MAHAQRRPTVTIAGGGPVGLTLAALLSRHGVGSLVIEADAGYCTGSRAICIARRSMEVLGWTGADRRLREIGLPWTGGRSFFRDAEVLHFRMPQEPGERFPPMLNVQQYEVEEAAHRSMVDGLVDLRWQTRVVDVRHAADGVEVHLEDAGGVRSVVETDWLVACDGGRSTVRERLGLSLEGTQYEGRYVIVDIEQKSEREVERLAWFDPPSNPGSTILMHRQPGDVWRIDYQIGDHEDPVEAVKPENVLPRVRDHLAMIGEDAPWKPLWISIYNAKCLTLDAYRHGRVLFAGDAAHLVPIFGVRGLNSGLDDAGNLAWRLALVARGLASADVLDDYSAERLHAARENIAAGAKSTEFMAPPHFGFRLLRDAALRLALEKPEVRSLINPRQTTPTAYPAVVETAAPHDRLVGRPAPDVRLPSGSGAVSYLGERIGRGFVLLACGGESTGDGLDTLVADLHPLPIEVVRLPPAVLQDAYGAIDGEVFLIRPDGYVARRWQRFDRGATEDALGALLRVETTEVRDAR